MGGKSSPPPPPDYTPIANASRESAELSYRLGREQLDWARERYAQDKGVTDRVIGQALDTQAQNNQNAQRDRARYEGIYQPLENDLARDASSYASPQRRELEMGRAGATVASQYDAQRRGAMQRLESFGVDPTSTRYAALDVGMRAAQGAAQAAAMNQAGQVVDATGRALRSEAINVGRGYPGQVAQTYGTALQAGNQAVNSGVVTTASGANTMGTPTQWQAMGNQALGTWGSTLNAGYQNQISAFNAEQNASSGWGSALGLVGGLVGSARNASGATGLGMLGLENGGAIPDDAPTMGGPIPASASPTGGRAVDDVPARLNVGEFVFPRDVMQWKGEEWAQKEVMKARQARKQGSPARPEIKPALPARPTFVSRPGYGALPVG